MKWIYLKDKGVILNCGKIIVMEEPPIKDSGYDLVFGLENEMEILHVSSMKYPQHLMKKLLDFLDDPYLKLLTLE